MMFYLGFAEFIKFFAEKERLVFDATFFGGFFLIIVRWSSIGAILQMISGYFFFVTSSYILSGIFI